MTNINGLSAEIARQLQLYASGVQDVIEAASKEEAQAMVKELKGNPSPKLTGSYRKGWRLKKSGQNRYIVYNKTDYQLTHLLEYPHALRNGGRSEGIAHIRPAEEKAVNNFLDRIEGAVRP